MSDQTNSDRAPSPILQAAFDAVASLDALEAKKKNNYHHGMDSYRSLDRRQTCQEEGTMTSYNSLGRSWKVTSAEMAADRRAGGPVENSPAHLRTSNGNLGGLSILEDLNESELHLKRKKAYIERVLEQQENLSEQRRRNEILQLCERMQAADLKPPAKSSRIKTNGSLPRDKSVLESPTSPVKSSCSSDDIFSLHLADGPGLRTLPSTKQRLEVAADADLSPRTPPAPGSPRRGIRTVLPNLKDSLPLPEEITSEVVQNHLGLPEEWRRSSSPRSPRGAPAAHTSTPQPHPAHRDHSPLPSDKVMSLSLELEFVQKERLKIMSGMTVLKSRLSEVENQHEETRRDAAMEQAFIKAELKVKREKLGMQRTWVRELRERVERCQREIDSWQGNRNKQQRVFSMSVENAELDLRQLRDDLAHCDDPKAAAELRDRIQQQVDVVDSEKKLYEDLEFRYLEEESVWLARKEELNHELSDAIAKFDEYAGQVAQLESWLGVPDHTSLDAENFWKQKQAYLQRLDEGQSQLDVLDARAAELVAQGAANLGSSHHLGQEVALSNAPSLGDLDSTASDRLSLNGGLTSMESSFYSYQTSLPLGAEAGDVQPMTPTSPPRSDELGRPSLGSSYFSPAPPSPGVELVVAVPPGLRVADAAVPVPVAGAAPPPASPGSRAQGSQGPAQPAGVVADAAQGGPGGQRPAQGVGVTSTGTVRRRGEAVAGGAPHGGGAPGAVGRQPQLQRLTHRQHRPLTRYLPVREGALDLRHHIESAGHAVELCPHVTIDETSCRGTLHKASARFGNWQKRWFIFDRTARTFSYCKSRRDPRIRGGILFQSIAEVFVDHVNGHKHANPNCVFVVKTTARSYQLMAPSPEAMRIWVDVIFTGAEAHQEFDY